MRNIFKILILTSVIGILNSCNSKGTPNYEYMPNMYRSIPYDTYGEYDIFEKGNSALIPPVGTIARGHSLFEYENNTAGYDLAKSNLKNPFSILEVDMKKGKELYNIYCAVCHGNKGDGQGILMKREKILGIPSYSDVGRSINEGSIYHTIYFGKNSMGSYANQLNDEERWLVTHYVLKLKSDLEN
ncbi:MAG: cytochrome c [Flavobacteriaceae bacterium]|nr:cytochrome c [Flavobacteriaceae bacterium]CAI8341491.1 MAG: Cytochrome c6 [Flavobacteriaceae bacterium]|tara:strand:+ start:1992 stop:2549 length:558 start_codon:yes stop_codon:yes gene_type:complete